MQGVRIMHLSPVYRNWKMEQLFELIRSFKIIKQKHKSIRIRKDRVVLIRLIGYSTIEVGER